ncbi:MAG: LPS assembly lipoprotein LptE [Candidatus Binatia bacterium]
MPPCSFSVAVLLCLAVGSAGCGYGFAGAVSRLPEDVHTISLGPIENQTRELGLEKAFLESLEDEIALRGRLEIVPPGQGDVILAGSIRAYGSHPVAFNSRDEALQYQLSVIVDMTLRRTSDQKLLWKTQGLREIQDYSAVPGVVVTSSSRFQRSTLNPQDLGRFTDIQVSEGQRREANERLIETLARNVYNQMMEDF